MFWFTWRRHRWLFLIAALFLLAFCTYIFNSGLSVYQQYNQIGPDVCNSIDLACQKVLYRSLLNLIQTPLPFLHGLLVLPLLVGVFVGAPLLSSEQRTASFVRTQSVTLRRWLTVKLGSIVLATLFFSVVIALLLAWWTQPMFALHIDSQWNYYQTMGVVFVTNVLFALLLSIAVGALIRRILPAMVVTFFILIVFVIGSSSFYQCTLPPTTQLYPATEFSGRGGMPAGDILPIYESFTDRNGQRLAFEQVNTYCGSLVFAVSVSSNLNVPLEQCSKAKHLQWEVVYQPLQNYWPMQFAAASVLFILSLLLIPAIYWISRKNLN